MNTMKGFYAPSLLRPDRAVPTWKHSLKSPG